jgi:hypothetical protein
VTISLATIAQYFRIGLEAGLCGDEEVRAWAFQVIASLDDPPAAMFELTWRYPRPSVLDNLNAVPGDVDLQAVGEWLLAAVRASLVTTGDLRACMKQIVLIVTSTNFASDDILYQLDVIDDDLYLAQTGVLRDVSHSWNDLRLLLDRYAAAPFAQEWTA